MFKFLNRLVTLVVKLVWWIQNDSMTNYHQVLSQLLRPPPSGPPVPVQRPEGPAGRALPAGPVPVICRGRGGPAHPPGHVPEPALLLGQEGAGAENARRVPAAARRVPGGDQQWRLLQVSVTACRDSKLNLTKKKKHF